MRIGFLLQMVEFTATFLPRECNEVKLRLKYSEVRFIVAKNREIKEFNK
jgi:hypothetical protein